MALNNPRPLLGLLAVLSSSALAASPSEVQDPFGGKTFCQFKSEYLEQALGTLSPTLEKQELVELSFSDMYLEGLRSGVLVRPSVSSLQVPLSAGGSVVLSSPTPGALTLQDETGASLGSLVVPQTPGQRRLRLDLIGSGQLSIDKSVSQADLEELDLFVYGEDVSITTSAVLPCLLVDGGREHSKGPLKFDGSAAIPDDGLTAQCGVELSGTSGPDTLAGTGCDDNINGGAGNDIIYGYGGNDRLWGSGNNDILYGNDGNDSVVGGTYDYAIDWLYGGQFDDTIAGQAGDNCYGDLGRDTCRTTCSTFSGCEVLQSP
jgi:hypothetical protein